MQWDVGETVEMAHLYQRDAISHSAAGTKRACFSMRGAPVRWVLGLVRTGLEWA